MPRDSRPCVECGGGDDEGLILLCEGCDVPVHAHCEGFNGPLGNGWLCRDCKDQAAVSESSILRPQPRAPFLQLQIINFDGVSTTMLGGLQETDAVDLVRVEYAVKVGIPVREIRFVRAGASVCNLAALATFCAPVLPANRVGLGPTFSRDLASGRALSAVRSACVRACCAECLRARACCA